MTNRPLALITGASSGIGEAFSRAFARRGYDIVIVARSEDPLHTLAQTLHEEHGVDCTVMPADLSIPDAGSKLLDAVQSVLPDRPIDVLINNAGFGMYGPVVENDAERALAQIRLNILTLTELTMPVVKQMVEREAGTIINIASTAAFQPLPGMAIYAATKAYVKSFSEALSFEVRDHNVRVLTVCPGPTRTSFFSTAGASAFPVGGSRSATQVVDHAIRVLPSRRSSIVDGIVNAFVARVVTRLVPTRVILAAGARAIGWTRQTVAPPK